MRCNFCIQCKHGKTIETSHEWIETKCDFDNKFRRPFTDACENFEENDDDAESETV